MDEELKDLVVRVRADTSGLARDIADARTALEGPLGAGADRAGHAIETALLRAVRGGKITLEDLRRTALSVLDSIAAAALRSGIDGLFGAPRQSGGAGLAGALAGLLSGAPGRATGGAVSPGRAYRVGERGPELFVPTASGTVMPSGAAPRDVRVSIRIDAASNDAPAALAKSGRQVARAVRAALMES